MFKKIVLFIFSVLLMASCGGIELEERTGSGSELKIKPVVTTEDSNFPGKSDSAKVEMICIDFPEVIYDSIVLGEDVEDTTVEKKVFPYKLAKYELSYNVWRIVYKWATSEERGSRIYTFENAGAEGAYGAYILFNEGGAPQSVGMPVTGISWRDAVVWCNAFSEMCELEPVYYTDPGFSSPIRNAIHKDGADIKNCPLPYSSLAKEVDMNSLTKGKIDNPYVNKLSNGWRLPYDYEWEYAARKCKDGSFLSGRNVPGDPNGPAYGSAAPSLLDQIKGITEAIPSSKKSGDYAWNKNNSAGNGTNSTAAGWDDSTPISGMSGIRMHKQGDKLPTELGFYDMGGNAYEWQFDYGVAYNWKYELYPSRALRGYTYQWPITNNFAAAARYICPPYVKMGGIRLARNF